MSNTWTYDDIAILCAVIDGGSFVGAANKLEIPTSTVSRRIQKLEDALGLRLLERNSRKFKLTHAGSELIEHCAPQIEQIRHSVGSMIQDQKAERGHIKITLPVFLGTEILSGWLQEFYADHPNIVLDIDLNNRYTDLIENGFDLAIRVGPQKDSNYIAQYLCTSRGQLCASPEFIKSSEPIKDIKDLQKHAFLKLHRNIKLEAIHGDRREALIHGPVALQANDIGIVRTACLHGKGIACLPDFAIHQALAAAELERILPDLKLEPIRDIYAVYPSRRNLAHACRVFIDFIREKFQHLQALPRL